MSRYSDRRSDKSVTRGHSKTQGRGSRKRHVESSVEQLRPTMEHVELMNPIILLITDTNADLLSAEFGRYSRDYDIRLARSASEATTIAEQIANTDHPLALMVADTALWAAANPADPITALAQFLRHWRQLVRTAKALVVAPVDRYNADHDHLPRATRPARWTAFLLLPAALATRSSTPRSPICSRTGGRWCPIPGPKRCGSSVIPTTRRCCRSAICWSVPGCPIESTDPVRPSGKRSSPPTTGRSRFRSSTC